MPRNLSALAPLNTANPHLEANMNTEKHDDNRIDAGLLQQLYADHLSGPDIYHASKFWDMLNQLNIEWLKTDGLDNFKRTVNNNYFNWMVQSRSVYFRNMARIYLTKMIHHPGRMLPMFSVNVGDMRHRTYVSKVTSATYLQRKLYALYLLFLHEYVGDNDAYGLFQGLEEPLVGNPIVIRKDGKNISQDISNSYLEYSYVRHALGDDFKNIGTVAEIGGGYGRLSYLFHLLHHNEGLKITLIDLPPAMLVADWYMRKVFPEANIMGYRRFSRFSEIEKEYRESSIRFLLPHQIELLPDGEIDLLINVSSLQEMSREQINHYYELVDKKAKYFYTKQWVMWDNPEDKISVPAVIYPTRPHWMLSGARLNPVHSQFFEAVFKTR